MKHPIRLTLLLMVMFLVAQFMGLIILNEYIDVKSSSESGTTVVNEDAYARSGFEPPTIDNESLSFLIIIGAVFFGTLIILLLMKLKKGNIWKAWYFLAVLSALAVAINPFVFKLMMFVGITTVSPYLFTLLISVILNYFKVVKTNPIVHNATEMLIYGGIAALMVPIIDMISATVILVLISVYDAFAVWKSKHMVKMAQFQKESKLFAGLMVNYKDPSLSTNSDTSIDRSTRASAVEGPVVVKSSAKKADKKIQAKKASSTKIHPIPAEGKKEEGPGSAILGGGDIAFPLIFSGVVMKTTGSYLYPLIITFFAAGALFYLFWKAEKGKFYPAMPFISAGCFLGYAVCWLLGALVGPLF